MRGIGTKAADYPNDNMTLADNTPPNRQGPQFFLLYDLISVFQAT